MAVIDTGSSTTGKANVDANYNLQVNLPTTASQAGYVQGVFNPTTAVNKINKITEDGMLYTGETRQLMEIDFNAATTSWSPKIGTNATAMTKAVQTNGFMRLNSGSSVTTGQGISIYSNRVVCVEAGYEYRIRCKARWVNANATNKQVDWGLGYYAFAAGQAAAMNEFIGFRLTTSGGYQAVLETSEGGAAASQTANLNAGVPLSDNVARDFELILSDDAVEYWVDGVYQTRLTRPATMYAVVKAAGYPFIARVFNSGAASAATTFDIAEISAHKVGPDDGQTHGARQSAMDKSSYYTQPDLQTVATLTHNFPASLTIPTAATGSNTASVLNSTVQMGGFYRMNGASFNVATHANIFVAAYQNPTIPTAAGAATNYRNFYVTQISVSPQIISTALTGGPYTAIWFAAIGATALSGATADADGTTAVAQKGYRLVPLTRTVSFAAAAALGTLESGAGDFTVAFPTPLVVHPGEFLTIGQRLITVTAVTAGTIDGAINVNGYWD